MKVALKTSSGAFVRTSTDGVVTGTAVTIEPTAVWELARVDHGVTLQSAYGFYLSAEGGGGGEVHANRSVVGPWEVFTPLDGGFRCVDSLHWLCADQGKPGVPLVADRTMRGAWETFDQVSQEPKPNRPPHVEIRGLDFVQDGQRAVYCGTDAFLAYRQYLDGVDLTPFFTESRELGFDLWRVFLMGSVAQNTVFDLRPFEPGYYDKLRPFADLVNAHGLTLLATVFVDAQDVMPDRGTRAAHWQAVADRLRGSTTILSGGNQFSKNGWSPDELRDPGMVWSRGSDVGDRVVQPHGAPVQEFHPRRDLPASLMDTVASAVFIYQSGRDWERPLIISEPRKYTEDGAGDTSNDPALAWEFARLYATECAGAIFHSWSGQRGQLLGPNQRACAVAWSRGMTI